MEKKRILLLDMYSVIIEESKGYFIPYTFEHFDKKEHDRLTKAFWEENLFTKAGINTVLFNRDNETYSGDIVNNFRELDNFLKNNSQVIN